MAITNGKIAFMSTDSSEPKIPDSKLSSENSESAGIGLPSFLAFAVLAYLMPFVVITFFGVYWGAGAAIVLFVLWVYVMPTTCMNGGLICSFVAMMLFVNTIAIVIFALIRLGDLVRGIA